MDLILDQGIPADAAALLQARGHNCVHVSELGMQQAEDEEILTLAAGRNAVVVTLDADFHALVAVRGLKSPSVIRLRIEGCRASETTKLVLETCLRYGEELKRGCLVSVKERKTTVHRLPIGIEP